MLLGDEDVKDDARPTRASARDSARMRNVRPDLAATACPPPVFHPLAYRSVVAAWPVEWRQRWGRRANDLEETGLSWRDAEAQAFVEVWNLFRNGPAPDAPALMLTASNPERN
jgi:hypothetical protein